MVLFLLMALVACSGGSVPSLCGGSNLHYWVTSLASTAPRFSPKWTPDGASIIFPGPSNNGGNIYAVSSSGSDLRRISKSKGKVYEIDYTPDVSPSGDRIVYATSRHGGSSIWDDNRIRRNFEIETTDLQGDDRQRLTENGWDDLWPRWSPDGESIAFFGSGLGSIRGGIYLMATDGGNPRVLFPAISTAPDREWYYDGTGSGFAWSPGGSAIAVVLREPYAGANPTGQDVLLAIPSDGSGPLRMFSAPYKNIGGGNNQPIQLGEIFGDPAWSPDGQRLAFLYHHKDDLLNDSDGCGNENPGWYLCIVHADGSGLSGIALPMPSGWNGTSLAWSPDGRGVLLTEIRENDSRIWNNRWVGSSRTDDSFREIVGEVYITSLDVITRETKTIVQGAYASWSPDGSRIAVLGKYDDGGYLATVAPDGSDFRVLVKADEDGDLELADD